MGVRLLLILVLVAGGVSAQAGNFQGIQTLNVIIQECKTLFISIYKGCASTPFVNTADTVCNFYAHYRWLKPTSEKYGTVEYEAKNQPYQQYQRYCSPWCGLCGHGTPLINPPVIPPTNSKCQYSSVADQPRSRIFNGSPSERCEYPWVVAIRPQVVNFPMCAGVLKDQYTVLTSKTCADMLQGLSTNDLRCVAGELAWTDPDPNEDAIPCSISTTNTDSGVVELSLHRPPTNYMSQCVAPACLQDQRTRPDLTDCKIASWGTNSQSQGGFQTNTYLQIGTVPTVRPCSTMADHINSLSSSTIFNGSTDNVMCASPFGPISSTDAAGCLGDNGGALMCRDQDTREMVTVGVIDHGDCRSITWFREINP